MKGKHLFCFVVLVTYTQAANNGSFPENFLFGLATSSYQIEGAWNEGGKGESNWDHYVHQSPSQIRNNDTGDIACDSYHKYKEDVELLADFGVDFYRFSISWPRILPTGYPNKINQEGIKYYQNLVKELVKRKITPVATIFHWDLPLPLAQIGWPNPNMAELFVEYSKIVIEALPEVGRWITFNEPKQVCHYGYGNGYLPPNIPSSGMGEYECVYTVLKAHAETYHMYKQHFPNYTAPMGITVDCEWYEPLSDSPEDYAAAKRTVDFECGVFAHPIFVGDWPESVKLRVYERSIAENYSVSRLPEFTPAEINYIYGTADFFGLNHYMTFAVEHTEVNESLPLYENDVGGKTSNISGIEYGSNGFPIVPWGVTKVLKYIKNEYKIPSILITEYGVSDDGSTLKDEQRIKFYKNYLSALLDAVYEHDVNVIGAAAWSLLDNFEWINGYSAHFGFYSVDFTNETRPRTPKDSVAFFKNVIKTKNLADPPQAGGASAINRINTYMLCSIISLFYLFKLL